MKLSAENKVRFGYGAAFLILLVAFSYSVFTTDQLLYHIQWVGKTNRVLHNLEGLMMEVRDLDASFKNGMELDTINYASFYKQHFSSIDSLWNLISEDTRREFISQRRLVDIRTNMDTIHGLVIKAVDARNRHSRRVDQYNGEAFKVVQRVESRVSDMQVTEKALLNLRSQRLNNSSGSMEDINIAILIIALLLAGYSWVVYNNENTAKKNANIMMVEYARELEKKIKELTDANNELTQLRSLQRFTSTGRIARMIAHEVRNPLTNINLSCDQLRDAVNETSQGPMLLDTIVRNSGRINQLVSELLDATKAQELKFRRVSINDLIDETLEIAKDRIKLEHISVKKDYDMNICDVEVDADKMKIAFLNIILNAVEAMDAGQGVLELRTIARDSKCVVLIKDNGHGIDQESLEKIFDPYYTGKSNGNGLGLTNTQNIILTHKGSIEVESTLGVGTTFTIVLDFAKDPFPH